MLWTAAVTWCQNSVAFANTLFIQICVYRQQIKIQVISVLIANNTYFVVYDHNSNETDILIHKEFKGYSNMYLQISNI